MKWSGIACGLAVRGEAKSHVNDGVERPVGQMGAAIRPAPAPLSLPGESLGEPDSSVQVLAALDLWRDCESLLA